MNEILKKVLKLYRQGKLNLSNVKMLAYKDSPCTTVKEIMKVYRCSDTFILDYRKHLYYGKDYIYLMGEDLRIFKEENNLDRNVSSLYIFFPDGLYKIEYYLKRQGLKPVLENQKEVLSIE